MIPEQIAGFSQYSLTREEGRTQPVSLSLGPFVMSIGTVQNGHQRTRVEEQDLPHRATARIREDGFCWSTDRRDR